MSRRDDLREEIRRLERQRRIAEDEWAEADAKLRHLQEQSEAAEQTPEERRRRFKLIWGGTAVGAVAAWVSNHPARVATVGVVAAAGVVMLPLLPPQEQGVVMIPDEAITAAPSGPASPTPTPTVEQDDPVTVAAPPPPEAAATGPPARGDPTPEGASPSAVDQGQTTEPERQTSPPPERAPDPAPPPPEPDPEPEPTREPQPTPEPEPEPVPTLPPPDPPKSPSPSPSPDEDDPALEACLRLPILIREVCLELL